MRLEIEPNVESPQFSQDQVTDELIGSERIDIGQLLSQGISAARNGDRLLARTLLLNVTEADHDNVDAWLWLGSISEYPEELLGFLSKVLEIDPVNERACQWERATRSLLAKTFVQRGITANTDGHPDFAVQCFDHALDYDIRCESAWFWKASIAATDDERKVCLEHVLEIDPDNQDAKRAMTSIQEDKGPAKLVLARIAAFTGNTMGAEEMVDEVLASEPDNVDAWTMRSQLALTFEEKLEAYQRVTELDPDHVFARAGAEFMSAAREVAIPTVSIPVAEPAPAKPVDAKQLAVETLDETATVEEAAEQPLDPEPQVMVPDHAPIAMRFEDAIANSNIDEHLHEYPTQDSFALTDSLFSEAPGAVAEAEPVQAVDAYTDEPRHDAHSEEDEPVVPEDYWIHETVPANHDYSGPVDLDEVNSDLASYDPFESKIGEEPVAKSEPPVAEPADEAFERAAAAEFRSDPPVAMVECAFCAGENEPQAFTCETCKAHLSMCDIDSLFGETPVDIGTIQDAVTRMEAEWNFREFNESELTMLGLGYFNLKNFDKGIAYIHEASRLNPNNVILAGQLNEMAIRIEDLKRQVEHHRTLPKGKTILVVDDSATVRKLISSKLEKSGHHVLTAADGIEAIELIESSVPDLVLLDITMPRMDGYAVCKLIRATESVKDVPVVMISGKDGFFDKVRGRMAGTTGYITKPFGPETLMRALETYLLPDEMSE